ncbi:hypothetical protein [Kitasatospora sp. NPDC097691]|uniref:hypothetical protein n=1 Tax=Kitasatospora sp. NPDC097691 TaxID=3157231 RepID=UPI0033204143
MAASYEEVVHAARVVMHTAYLSDAERAVRKALAHAGPRSGQLRVRDLGDTVRVELDADVLDAAAQSTSLAEVLADAGFGAAPVVIDGFASGRLNHEQQHVTEES